MPEVPTAMARCQLAAYSRQVAKPPSRSEPSEVERILAILGARSPRTRAKTGLLHLHQTAERHLDVSVVECLAAWLSISVAELLPTLSLSPRTLARRRDEGTLSLEESDRTLRVARVAAHAEDVLGARDVATSWLRSANRTLGGHAPLALLRTDAGAALVTDALTRVEHGVFS